ncbi:YfhO family protein, partial [Mycobacterium tuberculosis]|nr:YfhO family protein [Mycobacterium tuberculosis]
HKFADATVSVKRVTDNIQENADQKFYRIATDFAYSRTVPSLVSYPGLSTFSSSLERSTMDQFAFMGDLGVNAATQYSNGTPLTDTLYGVRYFMSAKDFDPKEIEAQVCRCDRFGQARDRQYPRKCRSKILSDCHRFC